MNKIVKSFCKSFSLKEGILKNYKLSNILLVCKNCRRNINTSSQSNDYDQLEQEAVKILNDEKKYFNILSNKFAVIQPIFQGILLQFFVYKLLIHCLKKN